MIREIAVTAVLAAALSCSTAVAAANPVEPVGEVFAIGKCYDPEQPLPQHPAVFDYNCDGTGVLHDMVWSAWDADGAYGTGRDDSLECQPNCAEGVRLVNPVIVHAWNPQPPVGPTCPPNTRFYSDMTIAYPDGVPPWIAPGDQWSAGTDFVTVDGMPAVHFSGLTTTCDAHHR
jgi:hypothetical protein